MNVIPFQRLVYMILFFYLCISLLSLHLTAITIRIMFILIPPFFIDLSQHISYTNTFTHANTHTNKTIVQVLKIFIFLIYYFV